MSDAFYFLVLGLSAGSLYVIGAMGVVLIYRSSGVINFAQGAVAMVGTFAFWELSTLHDVPIPLAIGAGVATSGLVGALMQICVMRFLASASTLTKIVASLGVLAVLQSLAALRYPAEANLVPAFLPTRTVRLLGADVGLDRILIFVIAMILAGVLVLVYQRSRFGLKTSAVADDPEAAEGIGISPQAVALVNWTVGGALGGVAGILLAPIVGLNLTTATLLIVPMLASAVVGRMTSFKLTVLGGLVIGVAQSEATLFAPHPAAVSAAIPFVAVAIALIAQGGVTILRGETSSSLPDVGNGRIRWGGIAFGALVALWFLWEGPTRWSDAVGATIVIALIVVSLVVVTGYAGQISLAQYTFVGFGAWVMAKLAGSVGWPLELSILVGVLATIPLGLIVGAAGVRTRGLDLAILSLCFAVAMDGVLFNNNSLNGGYMGITLTDTNLFGVDVDALMYPERYGTLCLIALILVGLAITNVRRSRVGRRLVAVRSNERGTAALGVSVSAIKLYAFVVGGVVAGLGGILLALRYPTVTFGEDKYGALSSIYALQESVVGGVGWVPGAVAGGAMHPGAAGTRLLDFLGDNAQQYIFLIGGLLLLFTVLHAPDGVAPNIGRMIRAIRKRPTRPTVVLDTAISEIEPAEPRTLEISNLTIRFGGVTAVNDASMVVRPATVTALIGANGAGKTTILDGITGFVRPASGSIRVDNVEVAGMSPDGRAQHGIGRSFQGLELFNDLTVLENLLVGSEATIRGGYVSAPFRPGTPQVSKACLAAIQEFELDDVLDSRPNELPHGQQRLVAIARALAAQPSVLLLDEPAAGLDETETLRLGRLIRKLADEWGVAVLLIEHDVDLVMAVSDQVYALNFGQMIAEGTPEEVRADDAVIAAYLGVEDNPEVQSAATPSPSGVR